MENKAEPFSQEITSRENSTFKNLMRLKQKKYRRELGLCVVEGEKQVFDLLKTNNSVRQIFVRKTSAIKFEKQLSAYNKVPQFILADTLFSSVTELETDPGILAVVGTPGGLPITYPFLLLDHIADAGNMGTLLRTAAAFGFKTVYCIDCVDIYSPKVLRASMGMQFLLNVLTVSNTGSIPCGTLIAADLTGENISAIQTVVKKSNGKYGLALGNEGNGLSDAVKKSCSHFVTIPMCAGVESLNVAVAGGILMHALG